MGGRLVLGVEDRRKVAGAAVRKQKCRALADTAVRVLLVRGCGSLVAHPVRIIGSVE